MENNQSTPIEETSELIPQPYSTPELLVSILTKPRQVIRYLSQYEPDKFVLLLLLLHGISEAFMKMMDNHTGDHLGLTTLILTAIFAGALAGLMSGLLAAFLLDLSGIWLKGQATVEQIRLVFAWSSIPAILVLLLLPIEIGLFGIEPFSQHQPTMQAHPILTGVFEFVTACLAIWTVSLLFIGLAEVQGFPVWKAILNFLLAGLLLLVPIAMIVTLFYMIS